MVASLIKYLMRYFYLETFYGDIAGHNILSLRGSKFIPNNYCDRKCKWEFDFIICKQEMLRFFREVTMKEYYSITEMSIWILLLLFKLRLGFLGK